ncbi:MAG: hybrid sensor histidine kinase/response regulator [Candidatus Omnitrophica bacterium]|nr:hybrid sensor histidine kinase/response regulator [Candidatus Omnitrophota bacterium]
MVDILVLDDEKNVLSSIKRTLRKMDITSYGTTQSSEALSFLEENKVKVVMVDQRMPQVSGLDFLSEIKTKFPYIVRILFTGYEDIAVTEKAINSGEVYKFIKKPWEEKYLKETIKDSVTKYDKEFSFRKLLTIIEQKNKELESLYKQQKLLASTIAHELRAPLTGIKASLQILASGQPGKLSSEQKKFIQKAINITNRVIRLANEVLDMSKLERGKEPLHLKQWDINKMVKEIAEEFKAVAADKGLALELEEKHVFPLIVIDRDKIMEVLENLINNAIKYTRKGKIKIGIEKNKKEVQISVRDTGEGVNEEDKKRIFQKFEQGKHGQKTTGSGLGLSISKEIILQHGGRIWVESKEQEGSSFFITIPLDATVIFKKQREHE